MAVVSIGANSAANSAAKSLKPKAKNDPNETKFHEQLSKQLDESDPRSPAAGQKKLEAHQEKEDQSERHEEKVLDSRYAQTDAMRQLDRLQPKIDFGESIGSTDSESRVESLGGGGGVSEAAGADEAEQAGAAENQAAEDVSGTEEAAENEEGGEILLDGFEQIDESLDLAGMIDGSEVDDAYDDLEILETSDAQVDVTMPDGGALLGDGRAIQTQHLRVEARGSAQELVAPALRDVPIQDPWLSDANIRSGNVGAARADVVIGDGADRISLVINATRESVSVQATAGSDLARALNADSRELKDALRKHGLDLSQLEAQTRDQPGSATDSERRRAREDGSDELQNEQKRPRNVRVSL